MSETTSNTTQPIVRMQQLNKHFGSLHVLNDIDLTLSLIHI